MISYLFTYAVLNKGRSLSEGRGLLVVVPLGTPCRVDTPDLYAFRGSVERLRVLRLVVDLGPQHADNYENCQ